MTKARDTANLVSAQTGVAVTIGGDPVILGVGNTETIRINGNGRIGIGTDGGNSTYRFETYSEANDVVSGSIKANNPSALPAAAAYVTVNSGSGTSGASGGWAAWNDNYSFAYLAGYAGNIAFSNTKGLLLAAGTANQHIKILNGTGYTETARFTDNNRLGIGTTNPGGPLHILGDGGVTPHLTLHTKTNNNQANWILFKDDGGNTGFIGHGENTTNLLDLWNYTNDGIRLGTNSIERVRITPSGEVGIGTTSAGTGFTLSVHGTAQNTNPTHGSLSLYGDDFAYMALGNSSNSLNNKWYIGHYAAGASDQLAFRYGTGPANSTGALYLHDDDVVTVGSAASTGVPNSVFQVKTGGAYFADMVSIGATHGAYGIGWYAGQYSLVTDNRILARAGYDITPGTSYDMHIGANFNGYSGGIAGDSSTMYLGHNSSGRELSFQTNETTRMVIAKGQSTVAIGYTTTAGFSASYSLALYNHLYMRNNQQVSWNAGDVTIGGNQSTGGYGLNIESYNSDLSRKVYSLYTSGTNKSVGINTNYTNSNIGLYVQMEGGWLGDAYSAIYSYGSVFCTRQYKGGLGAMTTGGTANWNDASNARSGSGYTLLRGSATNGPVNHSTYYHALCFEYGTKTTGGTGNMTQLAIPYNGAGYYIWYRSRYSGTWSSWTAST